MSDSLRPFHPSRLLTTTTGAACVFAAVDLAIGLRFGPAADDAARVARVGAVLAGHAALAAVAMLLLGGLVLAVGAPLRALKTPFLRGPGLVAALLLVVGFVVANRETLEGGLMKTHRLHDVLVVVLNVGGSLGVLVGTRIVLAAFGASTRGGGLRLGFALAAFLLGVAAQVADARLYVGLYPMLHQQLVAFALLAHAVAAACWTAPRAASPARVGVLVALALLAVSCGAAAWVRSRPSFRADASSVVAWGIGTRQISAFTEDLWLRAVPSRGPVVVPTSVDLSSSDDAAAIAAAHKALDAALPGRETLNLVLIAMDTVRADRVGFNGYARPTTPNVDKLAEDGFVFSRAYAPYPTSNYSYSALFTGWFPRATPVFNVVQKMDWKLPPETSIPGLLAKAGRTTIGISAFNRVNSLAPGWFGTLSDGFEVYNPDQTDAGLPAAGITDSALGALAKKRGKPYLLWAHYLEPHEPYVPWPEFNFGPGIQDAYDSEIAKVDQQVGRLIDALKKNGDYERTVFVVFSDHGEEFEEHGSKYHNNSVYEQQIRVPLLVRVPGLKGRRIDSVVNLVDVMPTLAALVKVKDPLARHGRNLLPLMLDPSRTEPGVSLSEFFQMSGGTMSPERAVVEGPKKLIRRVRKNIYEMYDVVADPLERVNLIGRDDALEARLRGLMAALDDRIDLTHGPKSESRPEDDLARNLAFAVDDLDDPIAAKAAAAWTKVKEALLDYMGEPSPAALYQLPEGTANRVADKLAEAWRATTDKGVKQRVLRFVCELGRPNSAPFLKERLADAGAQTLLVAVVLARLGDDAGRDHLKYALTVPSYPDQQEAAAALLKLGDPAGAPWLEPTLTGFRPPYVGRALEAMATLREERVGFVLRELAGERFWQPKPVIYKLALALGPLAKDRNCRRLLLRLATDGDPAIRERAVEAMKTGEVPQEELEAERESLGLETDGDSSVINRLYPLAFERYRAALKASKANDPGLRFRLARYLHLEGTRRNAQALTQEARALLEDLRANGPSELDRNLADRRLKCMGSEGTPPILTNADRFGAELRDVVTPPEIRPNVSFPVTFKIKNTGKDAWHGGYWQFAPELVVQWRGADGKLVEIKDPPKRFLPPEGVLPGEEIDVFMIAMAPAAGEGELLLTPEIRWSQKETSLGDKNVVWRRPTPYKIGK